MIMDQFNRRADDLERLVRELMDNADDAPAEMGQLSTAINTIEIARLAVSHGPLQSAPETEGDSGLAQGWQCLALAERIYRSVLSRMIGPSAVIGERRREQSREFAGRANAERKQAARERHAVWLAEDEKLRAERPAITSKKRRAEIIRERIGETHSVDRISKTLPAR